MNYRLVVNPGSPQAWEIPLRPGVNRIGRGEDNDFVIRHDSVSTHHCEVTLDDDAVLLKDLGSTNGSFINRAPAREARLQPGQHVQFGAVDLLFESNATPVTTTSTASPPIPVPLPVPTASARPAALRVNLPRPETPAEPAVESAVEEAAVAEDAPAVEEGHDAVCKSHPRTPARFRCNRCRKCFCELCVNTRGAGKYCRTCGQSLTPLRSHVAQPARETGFFGRLPGAFIYPFKGSGLLVLIAATVVFAVLAQLSGLFALLLKLAAIGYLYTFMQNIIHATAAEEKEMPDMPGFDDLFAACFRFIATVVLCFGLPVGLGIAKAFFEVEIAPALILGAVVLGCLYFPMAFLAVAMKDDLMAANPLVVVPAMLKAPVEYLVTALLLSGVFALRFAGDLVSRTAGGIAFSTRDISTVLFIFAGRAFWSLCSIYLLTVTMRILGLLYVAKKRQFGWFRH